MINSLDEIPGLKKGVSLKKYNTWNLDGRAEYFWEPEEDLLPDVLCYCNRNNIEVQYLGKGSNVLIAPKVDGLTICTKRTLNNISKSGESIIAQSGATMPNLAVYAAEMNYTGYEFLIGIPGTIGGGIAMNAGLASDGRREIKDIIKRVKIVTNKGEVVWKDSDKLDFEFRGSNILNSEDIVLSGEFKKTGIGSEETIRATMAEILNKRNEKQPSSAHTAGSTFKNPKGDNKRSAGWYIDSAGLKGYQIGGAKISSVHANWIENTGNATSEDVFELINHVQETVYREFGIKLEPEVQILR